MSPLEHARAIERLKDKTNMSTLNSGDLTFTYSANEYMLYYKGKPIGGAGVKLPRNKPLRGGQARANVKLFRGSAQSCVDDLVAGRGESRFLKAIAEIDAESGA